MPRKSTKMISSSPDKKTLASIQDCLDMFESLKNCLSHRFHWFAYIRDEKIYRAFDNLTDDYMYAYPPESCFLTMKMVRPIHRAMVEAHKSGKETPTNPKIWVVFPQDYDRLDALTPDSPEIISDPTVTSTSAGLFSSYTHHEGKDLAATGGGDLYWLANEHLVRWLRRRNQLIALLLSLSLIINHRKGASKKLLSRDARTLTEKFERIENKGKNQKLRRLINQVLKR